MLSISNISFQITSLHELDACQRDLIVYILCEYIMQDHQGISNVAPADAPLRFLPLTKTITTSVEGSEVVAEARIQDYINNLRFCISPTAFFQVW